MLFRYPQRKTVKLFANSGDHDIENTDSYQSFEPVHDKTYNNTCVTSKDSDQPINLVRVLVYHSLDSPEAVEGTCDQRWLWSDCADAQTDLSLRWPYKSYCKFCRALAHFSLSYNKTWFLLKVNFKRTDNFVWSVSTKSAVYFIYVSFFSPIPIVIYLFPSPIHDLYTYMYSTF